MEIFVDFGLFEFLAALGLAAIARTVYSQRVPGLIFLCTSIAAPAALLIAATGSAQRWIAGVALATTLVNAGLIFKLWQKGGCIAALFGPDAGPKGWKSRVLPANPAEREPSGEPGR